MSRRKQSNPKPLKWDGSQKDGEDGGDEIKQEKVTGETNSPSSPPNVLYDNQRESNSEEDDGPGGGTNSSSEEAPENSNDRLHPPLQPHHNQPENREDMDPGNMRKKLRRFVNSTYSHQRDNNPSSSSGHSKPEPNPSAGCSRASTPSLSDIPVPREDLYSLKHGDGKRSHTPEIPLNADLNGGLVGHERLLSGLPYLHLLPPAIRNDAARLFFMPSILPSEIAAASAQSSPASIKQAKSVTLAPESSRGPRFLCEPCNIKFSSAKTLEAHQTYYCSFRKDAKDSEKTEMSADGIKLESGRETPSSSPHGQSKKRERMSSGDERSDQQELDSSLEQSSQTGMGSNKLQKTGKLYACIYCSYSADKKVSLNRHMRMHSGPSQPSPGCATPSASQQMASQMSEDSLSREEGVKSSDGMSAFERYCQDCDIQFSNIKTFRVHKQYYCSTRHVLKAQQIAAVAAASSSISIPSESPPASKQHQMESPNSDSQHRSLLQSRSNNKPSNSPGSALELSTGLPGSSTSSMGSQPFVVLPTNPVIIVPYSFIQGASVLPSNVLPSQNALVVLPNGSVQCLPASSNSASIIPVPISSPSPQSIGSLMQTSLSHPGSSNQNQQATGSTAVNTGLSTVFNDPKDIIKNMSNSHSINNSRHSSDDSQSELDNGKVKTEFQTNDSMDTEDNMDIKHNPKSSPSRDRQDSESQPAIDLTVRTPQSKKALHALDEEKENRALGHTSPISVTPQQIGSRIGANSSPSDHFSLDSDHGSDKKLQRPSSASISSASSTPPSQQFEPKLNGILSQVSPGILAQELNPNLSYGRKTSSVVTTSKGQEYHPSEIHRSSGSGGGKNGGGVATATASAEKISPISAKLPGGAILTRANTQSLADLLLANSQDSIETSLRSSHPLLNSRSSPGPINPALLSALNPELALRFLDPSYFATLQHSLHQQQLQTQQKIIQQQFVAQSQTTAHGIKRGISKCIECDIVFYKYENFLVHKEHYCAATRNAVAGQTPPTKKSQEQDKTQLISPTCSSPKSDAEEKSFIMSPTSPPTRKKTPTNNTLIASSVSKPCEDTSYDDVKPRSSSTAPPPLLIAPSPTGSSSSSKDESDKRTRHSSQHACKSCGIKYSSLDTLQTHRNFYCRARLENPEAEGFPPTPEMIKALEIIGGGSPLEDKETNGLKCSKCRLILPEDQIGPHLQLCTGLKGATLTNFSSSLAHGWKCPCCSVYSPTMSAAQKHLETHSGIRAFKCLLCGYRGNTLRGMRTHIRMHFDKRVSDLQEGDYISCITSANDTVSHPDTSSSPTLPNFQANMLPNVESKSDTHSKGVASDEDPCFPEKQQPVKPEGRNGQQSVATTNPGDDSSDPVDLNLASPNRLHLCTFCNYTSTYKGNVVRHMKLVHKISEESANDILSSETLENSPNEGDADSAAENPVESRQSSPSSPLPPHSHSATSPNNDAPILPIKPTSLKFPGLTNGRKAAGENLKSTLNPTPNSCREKTCTSSRSSEEEDDNTSSAEHANNEKSCATQYCKSCNIYFHYPSTFVAHKQFYCSTHVPTPDAETVDRAGTPVQ